MSSFNDAFSQKGLINLNIFKRRDTIRILRTFSCSYLPEAKIYVKYIHRQYYGLGIGLTIVFSLILVLGPARLVELYYFI